MHTAGFSVRRIFPPPGLKDVISPRLRRLRGQALNHNVCTAHHDHGKLCFGVKLFYATFITRKQFTAGWSHLRLQANLNLAADLRAST